MHGLSVRHAGLLCLAVSVCLIADCLSVETGHRSKNQEGRMVTRHSDGRNVEDGPYRFTGEEDDEGIEDEDEEVVVEDEDEEDEERNEADRVEEEQQCGVTGVRKVKEQVLQMISDRRRKLSEMIFSYPLTRKNADKARQDLLLFTNSMHTLIKRASQNGMEEIDSLELLETKRLAQLIPVIEKEVEQLEMLNRTQEILIQSPRAHHLLKFDPQLCKAPAVTDWSRVSAHPDPMCGTIVRASSRMTDLLDVMFETVEATELDRIQKCAVDITLDLRTAHPLLVISRDGKQVSPGLKPTPLRLPDDPERFHPAICVLGNQGFRSGRFYYEVLVRNKTVWALGVARGSVNRKGEITLSPVNGFWTVWLRDGEHEALAGPSVRLSLSPPPQKVGVFVDYEGGQVSFYDVDNRSHIYSYGGHDFTETVYPFFYSGPNENGENAAPLVITPVSQTQ